MTGLTLIVGKYKVVYYIATLLTLRADHEIFYLKITITRLVWCEFSTTASTLTTRWKLQHQLAAWEEKTARTEVSTRHWVSLKPIQIFSINKDSVCVCVHASPVWAPGQVGRPVCGVDTSRRRTGRWRWWPWWEPVSTLESSSPEEASSLVCLSLWQQRGRQNIEVNL